MDIIHITSSNTRQLSKFSHYYNLQKICRTAAIKYPTTPQTCRYTTLWNIYARKLTETISPPVGIAIDPPSPLLSTKADTHFTVPRRVEGWVDLDGWLHTQTVYPPAVTNSSSNRAQYRLNYIDRSTITLCRHSSVVWSIPNGYGPPHTSLQQSEVSGNKLLEFSPQNKSHTDTPGFWPLWVPGPL